MSASEMKISKKLVQKVFVRCLFGNPSLTPTKPNQNENQTINPQNRNKDNKAK